MLGKAVIFLGAGICSIIVGIIIIIVFGNYKKIPNAKKVKGIICSKEYKYDSREKIPTFYRNIKYIVDGKEYYIKTKDRSSNYREGRKIIVKYNSQNPEQAITIHSFNAYIVPLVFILFGIYSISYTLFNQSQSNDCCTCLDSPMSDVCCNCANPYLNK